MGAIRRMRTTKLFPADNFGNDRFVANLSSKINNLLMKIVTSILTTLGPINGHEWWCISTVLFVIRE
jgi:hypothetical protein